MAEREPSDWREEFTTEELDTLLHQVPVAIQKSQERSARAHAGYNDPDGDQDVYGAGMSRGVQKEVRTLLSGLPSYREVHAPRSRRTLTFIGNSLIFPLRVGKQMPRNPRRVRLNYLSHARRELLGKTSNAKYDEPGLFGLDELPVPEQPAQLDDALSFLGASDMQATLFVPYYSSTPHGVGTMYFAPARLKGNHLEFTDPERITYQVPVEGKETPASLSVVGGFAEGDRPRTAVRLRRDPNKKDEATDE